MSSLDDLANQLETFEPSTLISIILVNLGARNATLIEHANGYLTNFKEYEIKHTKYPRAFKSFYKFADIVNNAYEKYDWEKDYEILDEISDKFATRYRRFSKKYGREVDRLFIKRVSEALNKHYPKLHMVFVQGSIFITKKPLDDKVVKKLQGWDNELVGEILEYPCRANYMKPGHPKFYSIEATADIPGVGIKEIEIFGNTFCDTEHKVEFEKLAKKYEKVLKDKKNVFQSIIKKVYVKLPKGDYEILS